MGHISFQKTRPTGVRRGEPTDDHVTAEPHLHVASATPGCRVKIPVSTAIRYTSMEGTLLYI